VGNAVTAAVHPAFRSADREAAMAEMWKHLEQLNRHYLSSVKEKIGLEKANGRAECRGAPLK